MGLTRISGKNGVLLVEEDGVVMTMNLFTDAQRTTPKAPAAIRAELELQKGSAIKTEIELHKNRDGTFRIGWHGARSPEYGQPFVWQEDVDGN